MSMRNYRLFPSQPAGCRRILIADDDEPTRRMLAEWLEQEGYQVRVAADGEQALEEAPRFLPDLILLDVTMPKLDGLEVARRVRARSNARSNVRILMVSGLSGDRARVAGLRAGADDYLTKPVRPRELLLRIQALLCGVPGGARAALRGGGRPGRAAAGGRRPDAGRSRNRLPDRSGERPDGAGAAGPPRGP